LCDSISDTNFSIAGFDTLLLFFILAPCKLFMLFLFLTIFTTYTNFLTPSENTIVLYRFQKVSGKY
ncbi:hypothetical protein ACOHX7_05710, partial [Rickettsia sp. R1]